jgi:flagellar assembly protein FliH
MASAKEKNQEELKAALKQIADLMHSLKDIHESLYQELEDSAVEVVFEAVAKIIGHAATDKDMVYNITREAIERVKGRNKIIIRVSTHDYDMIKTALSHAENSDLHNSNLTVIADNLVQLGGCLIETEAGSLDARLEIQMQRLKDALLSARKLNEDA